MCVETMSVWREGRYDLDPQDTLNEIKERFSQYPKEQMKLVFEEVESGFIWDIETDEIKHEDDEDDIDGIIEAILRENEEAEMPDAAPVEPEVVAEMEDTIEKQGEELEEAYRTVNQLKSIINEVNLLNAKLLYTNKLFRNFELSENQKMKVIENFDRAGNPREVKLVFTTLAESFKRPTTKKRVVKESAASRPTRTTAPSRQTTQVLTEGFELANRWKKLAGLL